MAEVLVRCLFNQISSEDTKNVVFSCLCVNQNIINILVINQEKNLVFLANLLLANVLVLVVFFKDLQSKVSLSP